MMKTQVRERRFHMIQEYSKSHSEKKAIESTSKKFGVKKDVLYVDWSRRDRWLKDVIDLKDAGNMICQLLIEVQSCLQEIDELAKNADNDNARLGAHKLRINILFKLIDLYRTYDNEELRERLEKLERIVEEKSVNW